jgi:pimeloyl-ACP methyl ester carboxylesterase
MASDFSSTYMLGVRLVAFPSRPGGYSEGCAMGVLFAATYPDRVSRLILYGGFARFADNFASIDAFEELIHGVQRYGVLAEFSRALFLLKAKPRASRANRKAGEAFRNSWSFQSTSRALMGAGIGARRSRALAVSDRWRGRALPLAPVVGVGAPTTVES